MATKSMAELAAYAPIWSDWPSLVGPDVARCVTPLAVSNGKLHVVVGGDAMRHRLQLQKQSILAKLNGHLKSARITDIVFELSGNP